MSAFKIGLRYCGGCNCEIDREEVAKGILRSLDAAGLNYRVLYGQDEEAPDIWLTLSGCERDCTSRKDNRPEVVVAGRSVDRWKADDSAGIIRDAADRIIELAKITGERG